MLLRQSFDIRFLNKIREISDKYGIAMLEIDGIGPNAMDVNLFTKQFLRNTDSTSAISSDPNANVDDQSIVTYETEFNKSIHRLNAYYITWEKMVNDPEIGIKRANKILEMSINGILKWHDQSMWLKPYCYSFSLHEVVTNGLTFIKKVKISQPKHVSSYINHVIQFLAFASNQIAGAAAFPDFFVYLDWFCRIDWKEDYLEDEQFCKLLRQELQSFIFSANFPYRSSQSAFCNLSVFDKFFLTDLFENVKYPDFSDVNLDSVMKLQKFYMRWFVEESKKQTFTFPVNTATLYVKDGKIQDEDFLEFTANVNSETGVFNIFTGALGRISSCCRLCSDISQTKAYTNSFGAGGVSIGSHRVVTLNLPRIALESENDFNKFLKSLEYYVLASQDILYTHRKLIQELIALKKLPLYTLNYMHLNKQFSTIGFIGLYEAIEILGFDMKSEEWHSNGITALNKINELNNIKATKTNTIWNMEQIPGESAAFQLAKKDKLLFHNHSYDLYSNQYFPLWKNIDIEDRIKIAGKFDKLCSGGAISHITTTDPLTPRQMQKIIEFAAANSIIYFAINIAQCRCKTCDKLFIGKFDRSPCHNAPVTQFLRVVGFLTAVDSWAPPRRKEFTQRQFYSNGGMEIHAA